MLADQEERFQAQSADQRQRVEALLADQRRQLAQDRLERQAQELEMYRQTAVTAAVNAREIAPQFVPFIGGSSHEEVDASIAQVKAATAEILTEVAGQQDAQQLSQTPQQPAVPGEQIDWEHLSLEDWAGVRGQYINTTAQGLFG
jgi:hypothetical protein